ncbi:MAG: MaoC family dehydratase [Candidatus Taylorbacteria bacterium]|nr:MaoC family dehydratase [Candidatus Taylorbacteria bacterium]
MPNNPTKAKSFVEIHIGDTAEFDIVISEDMHAVFSRLSGDGSPIHMDAQFAKSTKFGKPIGFAFLLASFFSKLYGEHLPGGSSVCLKQELSFIKPYYVGDIIRVKGEVISKSESTKLIEIKAEMWRNDQEKVLSGLGTVQLLY